MNTCRYLDGLNSRKDMPALKFEIKRKCEVCGSIFVAKTLDSKCCSEKCMKVAWKRRKDEEKKQERLKAIADQVPDYREYISIPEAVAMYGVGRDTLYRLIRIGQIQSINLGARLTRINRKEIDKMFPKRFEKPKKDKDLVPLYNMEPENCYTIGEISKKYRVDDSTVWAHIRKYSIPTRQIGNYVYAPKKEIDKLYKSL